MNIKNTILVSLLFIVTISTCKASLNEDKSTKYKSDIKSTNNPSSLNNGVKLGKITTHKKVDKKIIILMILGLSIPLTAGYYVIKKK